MDKYRLYIDESGKTGSIRYDEGKIVWNYDKQPYFALCGIAIPESCVEEVEIYVDEIRKKYKIQGALKSTKNNVKAHKDEMICDIINFLNNKNCDVMIEVVGKKFCICMMISDYCVLPYYDSPNDSGKVLINRIFANYIYHTVSDKLLGDFVRFFDENSQEINRMLELCNLLKTECKNNSQLCECIEQTIDSIQNYKELGLQHHNLFPLIDYYKGKTSCVAVVPHINSLDNILNRVLEKHIELSVITHDEIRDLSEAIIQTVNRRSCCDGIEFAKDELNKPLQFSDIICGLVSSGISDILDTGERKSEVFEKIINNNVNFVSSFREQSLLFQSNSEMTDLNMMYEQYVMSL